ncbi:MAG: hypothetical protein ABIK73_07595 [candidate division WOR-3 bacterium]
MAKIPSFDRPAEIKFAYIKFVPYDIKESFVSAVDTSELWKSGKLGFFFKKPETEAYVPFPFDNFAVAHVQYSIDGYNKKPTYYSSKSLDKKGPFLVYDAETNVCCYMGLYHYDKAKHAHVIGSDILPAGCRRTTTLVGVPLQVRQNGYDGFILFRLGSFLRNAVIDAIKEAIIADGQKPSDYITVGDMVCERQFWAIKQKRDENTGYPVFVPKKLEDAARDTNVYFVPVFEATYIEEIAQQERIYNLRKEYETYMFERMSRVRNTLIENNKPIDALPEVILHSSPLPALGSGTNVAKREKGERFNAEVFPNIARPEDEKKDVELEPLPF